MKTTTYNFKEVRDSQPFKKKCSSCGKTIKKVMSAMQTLNPFNQNTPSEIHKENAIKIQKSGIAWMEKAESCAACKKKETPDVWPAAITLEDLEWLRGEKAGLDAALKKVRQISEGINQRFAGKRIVINGQPAVIDDIYEGEQLSFSLIRKDRKGLVERTDYTHRIDNSLIPKDTIP